jgi:quaternary ammonium compound-resistance protein SugE
MAWIQLLSAGLLEIVWAIAMKHSEGFTRPGPTTITIVAMIASFALLAEAMKSLPLGTSYMIWTGVGAVGAFIAGIILFGEALTPMRIAASVLIVGGMALMKVASPG